MHSNEEIQAMRRNYNSDSLDETTADVSPFAQFEKWFSQAREAQLLEPNAMIVATIDENNCPMTRTVLLKGFDENGFVFYTNFHSRKAQHLENNPNIALQFLWLPLERQVMITGRAEKLSTKESLSYFLSRPKGSQIGAWVSQQSQIISNKSLLLAQFEKMKEKFKHGDVPLPDFWGGYRVVPERFEFWQGGENRLHDRLEYTLDTQNKTTDDAPSWVRHRLSP
ncbi:pyridoxamine 5'-phosphate oxidase [Thiomicrorhabdus indica]|uniref:pyridoxamine 5'-phosphate oxidase n=1 Tax=Thiomicrorhabdus indica TaxID=2267253 RepID=UPI0023EA4C4B|nr:pyridoxamine 5'-phosphate oxidase [Thiomicrorhabdus indica]